MTDERVAPLDDSEDLGRSDDAFMPEVDEVPGWLQLGVIVSDGSGSMLLELEEPDESLADLVTTKAAAANSATLGFLDRMEAGRKKQQFSLAWVSFNDRVTDQQPPTDVDRLRSAAGGNFDPTKQGSGGTRIWTGLEAAANMVEQWQASPKYEGIPMSAVIVLMTDGEDADTAKTIEVANRIKELPNTRLAACFFATKGQPSRGAEFLRRIVTQPEGQHFKQVYDAEALRDFFHASVTAVS